MKLRSIGLALVVLLLTSGVALAGKEAYKLVMSKDKKLCQHMRAIFNDDLKKYKPLTYEKHKEFIVWEPVGIGGDRTDKFCRQSLKHTVPLLISWTRLLPYSTRPPGRMGRRSSFLCQLCASSICAPQ